MDSLHRPLVATDVVLFTEPSSTKRARRVLLIVRGNPPFKGSFAFPGGLLDADETLRACAERELFEETGIQGVELHELGPYSEPKRDPRGRCISFVYVGVVDAVKAATAHAGDDAAALSWVDVDAIEESDLAFDHAEILARARAWIAARAT